ncbi:MAG: hypothetical protein ND895_01130 [Pyrinomonadaceae bacterium]|nr:hypothetical protein [Pyrinomonadaceae bacterium]
MSDVPIWRYLSLAKYIDLLRTRSLYFPKASRFQDETEGKWWGHAHLYENAQRWRPSPANVQTLEELLERAGQDPYAIIREIHTILESANEWVRNILSTAMRASPNKRREYLEYVISSWKRHYDDHNPAVQQWKSDSDVFRDSTYISCWNRASSMSLAMWEMYGGGSESVAVRSTISKLKGLIEGNASFLQRQGLVGDVAEVEYLEGLKNPDEVVQDRIYEIIFGRDRDLRLGLFAIKPNAYEFEHEVRAILYPKRDLLDPIEDPHPNVTGFSLPISPMADGERSLADFVDSVYLHPMLDKDSLMVQAVTEINRLFDVAEIPVVADKIEALGSDVALP